MRLEAVRLVPPLVFAVPGVRAPETQPTAQNTPGKAARFPEPAAEPGEQAENAAGSLIKADLL